VDIQILDRCSINYTELSNVVFFAYDSGLAMGAFSLTWPAAMPIYWKKESFAKMTVSVKKEC